MTIVWADSFDHYTTLSHKGYSSPFGNGEPTISASGARTGGQGLYNATNQRPGTTRTFGGSATNGVIGCAFRGSGAQFGFYYLFGMGDASQHHIFLGVNAMNQVFVARHNGTHTGVLIAIGPTPIPVTSWNYYEMAFSIHDSAGTVDVYVNGEQHIAATGLDTRNGGNGQFTFITVGSFTDQVGGGTTSWDDLVVQTGTTTPLGDVRVENIMPNGNGNSSVLVGSDGNSTDNYLLVDETPGSSSDYVESSTPGDKDTYAYANLSTTSGPVIAVCPAPFAAKTDGGTRSIVSVARHSGSEEDSAAKSLTATYLYLPDYRTTKPGGGAWSIADVNAAEFGVKVNA